MHLIGKIFIVFRAILHLAVLFTAVAYLQLRGKLIGALDKVSGNLQNVDQIAKTTQVMSSVTSNPDEVKDTDKVWHSIHIDDVQHWVTVGLT